MKAQKYMKQKVLNPRIKTFCWFSIFRTELRSYCQGSRKATRGQGIQVRISTTGARGPARGSSPVHVSAGKTEAQRGMKPAHGHGAVWPKTTTQICGFAGSTFSTMGILKNPMRFKHYF